MKNGGGGISRIFLGWERPGLVSACEFLLARGGGVEGEKRGGEGVGEIDLGAVAVVVPGGRVGRNLRALLVERAAEWGGGRPLVPPKVLTPGGIAPMLLGLEAEAGAGVLAGGIARRLAWAEALRSRSERELAPLVPRPPARDDLAGWLALGEMLERCHCELAGELLLFRDVPQRATEAGAAYIEEERWRAAAAVQERYADVLRRRGMRDADMEIAAALRPAGRGGGGGGRRKAPVAPAEVVLLGVADLTRAAREALRLASRGGSVTALVFAPESLADRFDELGCATVRGWGGAPAPAGELEERQIVFADAPADQAERAFEAIARFDGALAPDQIALGAPDEAVIPHLERAAERLGGVRVRSAAGRAVRTAGPWRLLDAAAAYIEDSTMDALRALVRHPDAERWLRTELCDPDAGEPPPERWLAVMDDYAAESLHGPLNGEWHTEDPDVREILSKVYGAVESLLAPLAEPPAIRPAHEWAEPLLAVLGRIYERRRVSPHGAEGRLTLGAGRAIRSAIDELRALNTAEAAPPPEPASSALPLFAEAERWSLLSAPRAARLVLEACADDSVPDEPDADSVEILGWLELPLDPSEAVIVTGMNEGVIPAASGADALLPDGLREALGVACSRRRHARDAYILCAIAGSRRTWEDAPPKTVFIAGRRTADGDPLWPSRLLLNGGGEGAGGGNGGGLVQRVRRFLGKAPDPVPRIRLLPKLAPGAESAFKVAPLIDARPVNSMRVTSFKTYLASPYLFFLKHVLYLQECDDGDGELDALSFGTLIHDALEVFARTDARHSTDPGRIGQCLEDELAALANRRFGPRPAAAVRLQLEIARRRLAGVARWQAERARSGWLIAAEPEWRPSHGQGVLVVDSAPMRLRGRIDRVEKHEADGRLAILDFKTGDSARDPKAEHRGRDGWRDLQLPLYRHLAAELGAGDGSVLGYVVIPSGDDPVELRAAEWTDAELKEADDTAADVVRRVRAGEFRDVGAGDDSGGVFSALCGTGFLGGPLDDEEEGGSEP